MAAAKVTGGPVDVLIAKDDIKIAIAKADQLQLECIKQIFVLWCQGVVISDIVPCNGEHIVGGVETLVDQI